MPKEISRAELEERIVGIDPSRLAELKALLPDEEPTRLTEAKKTVKAIKPDEKTKSSISDFISKSEGDYKDLDKYDEYGRPIK